MSQNLSKKLINCSNRGYPIIKLTASKIEVHNDTVVYSTRENEYLKTYNIPFLNCSVLILGYGTSITQAASIKLSQSKTLVLFASSSYDVHSIIQPEESTLVNHYNLQLIENLYVHSLRIPIAKNLLLNRLSINYDLLNSIPDIEDIYSSIHLKLSDYSEKISSSNSIEELLGYEGNIMKILYSSWNTELEFPDMNKEEIKRRTININYKCYALASVVLTSLGLSYSLHILHGRTNSGSLKYDIADLIKGLSTPLAILSLFPDSQFYVPFTSDHSNDSILSSKIISYFEDIDLLSKLFKYTLDSLELSHA